VDISHPNASNQAEAVHQTLAEIGAGHIPMITALNKIDRLADPQAARAAIQHYPQSVAISARTGDGIPDMLASLRTALYETYTPVLVRLPYQQGALISLFHEAGQIERVEHERGCVLMGGRIPGRLVAQFNPWQVKPGEGQEEEHEHKS
jgi:GTP-binding protein HflX